MSEPAMQGIHSPAEYDQVQTWLERLTYKPGVTFTARFRNGLIEVAIEIKAFNSYRPVYIDRRTQTFMVPNPEVSSPDRAFIENKDPYLQVTGQHMIGDIIPLVSVSILPTYLPRAGEGDFINWLRKEIHRFEIHEADEWFKEKGRREPLFDPHKTQERA